MVCGRIAGFSLQFNIIQLRKQRTTVYISFRVGRFDADCQYSRQKGVVIIEIDKNRSSAVDSGAGKVSNSQIIWKQQVFDFPESANEMHNRQIIVKYAHNMQ